MVIFNVLGAQAKRKNEQKKNGNSPYKPHVNTGQSLPNPTNRKEWMQEQLEAFIDSKEKWVKIDPNKVKSQKQTAAEGECLPEHNHGGNLAGITGEGMGLMEGSEGPIRSTYHTPVSAYKDSYKTVKIVDEQAVQSGSKQEQIRQAMIWNTILKRPKFGVLPKDR